jgi:uncharacterized protein YecE (DUF72 family)
VKERGRVRIGVSGWRYAGWRGVFYPPKLAQRRELEFAACTFPTVEINGTFYSLQRPSSFREWRDETPDDFVFAVKGSRFLTHMLKLRGIEQGLANFFASGLLELGPKLGPILWQFAPQMKFDRQRFAEFFAQLPRTQGAAARLAKEHDTRLKHGATANAQRGHAKTPIRHCVEIRDESFVSDALDLWADRVAAWAAGTTASHLAKDRRACETEAHAHPRDVYVYFDNDAKVRAPFDAQMLQKKIDERLHC